MIFFEWDESKARINERKHGVRFDEAVLVFDDPFALFLQDRVEGGEIRWQAIGRSSALMVVLVAHAIREQDTDEVIRIISARRATRKERTRYEQSREENA